MPEPMSDARLAVIEGEHQPDPWLKEHRGLLWCTSPDCHQAEGEQPVHVDWPCDAAELLTEVRHLRRALRLSEASRGVPSVVGRD